MNVFVLSVQYEADVECAECGAQWIETGSGDPLDETFVCPYCEDEDGSD
jgi:DNA-directed RNA polymerase subunit RPC12/RpoP